MDENVTQNKITIQSVHTDVCVVEPSALNHKNVSNSGQQIQLKMKRKHRRGKPKPKNSNWKFQMPKDGNGLNQRGRQKLIRSNSLAPYNTNRFLMEEHMVEVPSFTSGYARDSSFSVDSEDNYFFSLPEDEEDFLTKEFSNVYERARIERLENLSKQELIQEYLQLEDRFTTDQGTQTQVNTQRIRCLEQKIKELSRENYNLRCQLMRSNVSAPTASPPKVVTQLTPPLPMESPSSVSSSVDTESDSSSSVTSSTSSSSSSSNHRQSNNSRNTADFDNGINCADAVAGVDVVVFENKLNESLPQCDSNSVVLNVSNPSANILSPKADSIKSPLSILSNTVDEPGKDGIGD